MNADTRERTISTLDVLLAARKLIEKEENWCQRFLSKRPDGSFQNGAPADDACAYCMNGAIFAVVKRRSIHWSMNSQAAIEALERLTGEPNINFNDTHTHAEVIALFDRAIEAERGVRETEPSPQPGTKEA